ncbi:MAG: hypothetical protein AB2697_19215 [Candidatus Thiodiazotropha endolucinida]
MDSKEKVDRELLFAMIWDRPATHVAEELGISDVALGKLCRRLQVPKPPRGYWARISAGRKPRRPPLKAFQAETETSGRLQHPARRTAVRLSQLQREFFDRGLKELAAAGADTAGCDVGYDGIRRIEGSVAAQVLILVQNRFDAWLAERGGTSRSHTGAFRSMRGLVEKLLPLANEQVLVLQPEPREDHYNDPDKAVIVRLSAILQRRIGELYRLARDHKLAYAAADLHGFEHAWSVVCLRAPSRYSHARSELCVATDGLWVRCTAETPWGTDQFETAKIPLEGVVPVELLPNTTVELPAEIRRSVLKPYAKRLRALKDVEDAFDLVSSAVYRIDGAVPDEHLALVDRLWFGDGSDGPFSAVRRALTEVESDLESWEHRLATEQARLVKDVLGVGAGDDVITESRGRVVRLRLEGTTVHVSEKAVNFHLWGMRYRKDGLPGKRQEYLVLSAENDLE